VPLSVVQYSSVSHAAVEAQGRGSGAALQPSPSAPMSSGASASTPEISERGRDPIMTTLLELGLHHRRRWR
jgi:hypothetical protein